MTTGPPADRNPIWGDDWPSVRDRWPLDPTVTFLNHGSFGATPRAVLAAQREWQDEMEREPVEFLWRRLPGELEEARRTAAAFVGADPDGFAFVPNATTGVATVLASLDLQPGERILLSDHAYPAVRNAAAKACRDVGTEPVIVHVPLPLPAPAEIVTIFGDGITDRIRLVIVDQVTSPTAALLPAADVARIAHEGGALVLVDGAHAPGMLPADVVSLGADFWTGNFHKWVCAPKGAGALVVAPEHRARVHPLVTSHGYDTGFREEFDWTGTKDDTAYLTVPAALAFMDELGWDRVRGHNHQLVAFGQRVVSDALGTDPPVPPDAFGSMAVVALPEGAASTLEDAAAMGTKLFEAERIEVPFVAWNGRGYVRLSAQAYNCPADYERLADALPRVL
jgi:isopenicillin-N epimerase